LVPGYEFRRCYSWARAYKERLRGETIVAFRESSEWKFIDTRSIVDTYRADNESIFSGIELYVDHAHFSYKGLKLIADKIDFN